MCLQINSYTKFKCSEEYIYCIKSVEQTPSGKLVSPIMRKEIRLKEEYVSNRQSNELTKEEKDNARVNHGIHVISIPQRAFFYGSVALLVKCYMKDFVTAGVIYAGERNKRYAGEAVFMKVTPICILPDIFFQLPNGDYIHKSTLHNKYVPEFLRPKILAERY